MTLDLAGRHVLVAGLGVTGRAAATALLDLGATVTATSDRDDAAEQAASGPLADRGVPLLVGRAAEQLVGDFPGDIDLVVTSPGLRPDHPMLAAARATGREVIGEPELAWRLRGPDAAPWLGITGTNGKTTTTGMLAGILQAAGLRAVAAGNVGLPLVDVVRADPAYDALAVEISSAQLHWSPSVRFEVAAILNIVEDHLDWHTDFAAYVAAKRQVWTDARAVTNADDPLLAGLAPAGSVRFSVTDPETDYSLVDGELRETATGEVLARLSELAVTGPHNAANALAASAVARAHGVEVDAVHAGLVGYRPGRHRNEVVTAGGGVSWVDDSKATNPHAAAASLSAYPSVVWIAGGLLKGAAVDDLVREQAHRLRAVVLLGRDRDVLAAALARHAPDVPVVTVTSSETGGMDDAVRLAAGLARPGDTVLLAPAAASFDMFRDYGDRGDRFAAAARTAAEQA